MYKSRPIKNSLNKEEMEIYFQRVFSDEANVTCFECGKKSKQWAETCHAIFLCLNCAAIYKEIKSIVEVKSIGLDLWSKEELALLASGGNRRFKEFLALYNLEGYDYKDKLRTKAATYYRKMLVSSLEGKIIYPAPTKEEGKEFAKEHLSLTEMSPQEIFDEAKEKVTRFGLKTKELGGRAITKVQYKVKNVYFKKGAKETVAKVNTKASQLWGIIINKIGELKGTKPEGEEK